MSGVPADEQTPPRPLTRERASERVRDADFPLAVRGYDRRAVDEYVAELTLLVDELEGRQLREKVVQRALDEVGEETASILQRAHETADELAARSRAQAEGRIQRAEREAEIARADADKYAQEVAADTQRLWDERQALIEDVRRLADEVLATAEEATERVAPPDAVAAALAAEEQPTAVPFEPAEDPVITRPSNEPQANGRAASPHGDS